MALEVRWRLLYHFISKKRLVKIVRVVIKIPFNFIVVPGENFFLEGFRI